MIKALVRWRYAFFSAGMFIYSILIFIDYARRSLWLPAVAMGLFTVFYAWRVKRDIEARLKLEAIAHEVATKLPPEMASLVVAIMPSVSEQLWSVFFYALGMWIAIDAWHVHILVVIAGGWLALISLISLFTSRQVDQVIA